MWEFLGRKVGRCAVCMSTSMFVALAAWAGVTAALVAGVGQLPLVGLLFVATTLSSLVLLHAVAFTLRRLAPATPGAQIATGCGCRGRVAES